MNSPKQIVGMPQASLAEDGSSLQIELAVDDGTTLDLRFNSAQFEDFVGRASQLFTGARNRKLAIGGHFEVQPVAVVAAAAQSAIGGNAVVLAFRAGNGVIYHFALSESECSLLRVQMRKAEESSRAQGRKTRQ